MASLTTTEASSDTITIGNNSQFAIQVDAQRSNDNIILPKESFERILDVVKKLEDSLKELECKVKNLTEEATKDRVRAKEAIDIYKSVIIQRKFTEGYCYKSNTGKTIIQIIKRMEYDPVNKNGKVKVKDMSTNEEKTVSFSQHLSEAFDVGDWQETIVLRESINYDGITILSVNTTWPNEVNARKRKTPPQTLLIPPKGGEITPEEQKLSKHVALYESRRSGMWDLAKEINHEEQKLAGLKS